MVIVACEAGVKRGKERGNLGARSNIVISTRSSQSIKIDSNQVINGNR